MPSNYATLDTSIIARLILHDDPSATHSAAILLADDTTTFIIPDFVFFEIIHVLEQHYNYPRPLAAESLTALLASFYNLSYDRAIVTDVLPSYVTHPQLSFADCYLAHYATQHQAEPLYTFDHKLANQTAPAHLPTAAPVSSDDHPANAASATPISGSSQTP